MVVVGRCAGLGVLVVVEGLVVVGDLVVVGFAVVVVGCFVVVGFTVVVGCLVVVGFAVVVGSGFLPPIQPPQRWTPLGFCLRQGELLSFQGRRDR